MASQGPQPSEEVFTAVLCAQPRHMDSRSRARRAVCLFDSWYHFKYYWIDFCLALANILLFLLPQLRLLQPLPHYHHHNHSRFAFHSVFVRSNEDSLLLTKYNAVTIIISTMIMTETINSIFIWLIIATIYLVFFIRHPLHPDFYVHFLI